MWSQFIGLFSLPSKQPASRAPRRKTKLGARRQRPSNRSHKRTDPNRDKTFEDAVKKSHPSQKKANVDSKRNSEGQKEAKRGHDIRVKDENRRKQEKYKEPPENQQMAGNQDEKIEQEISNDKRNRGQRERAQRKRRSQNTSTNSQDGLTHSEDIQAPSESVIQVASADLGANSQDSIVSSDCHAADKQQDREILEPASIHEPWLWARPTNDPRIRPSQPRLDIVLVDAEPRQPPNTLSYQGAHLDSHHPSTWGRVANDPRGYREGKPPL